MMIKTKQIQVNEFSVYKTVRYVFILFFIVGLLSCGTEKKNENIMDESQVQQTEQDDDFLYVIPSPLQIASILKKSGLVYTNGLTNETNNVAKYTSNFSKTVNFGIYSADLAYCVLNNQSQESINYLKVVNQLADELGLSSIFKSGSLLLSFENNLGNEDSLIQVLVSLQEELDVYLEDNEQKYLYPVIFAGAWIESVYIGSNVINKEKESILKERILEQMKILNNIVYGLDKHPNKDTNIEMLISDLKDVKTMFYNISALRGKDTSDPEVFENVTISTEELSNISKRIEEIRTKLINI